MALERIYLPMSTRPAGYCVTSIEQTHLARKFGLEIEIVRKHLIGLIETIAPQKTANKTKAIIDAELNAVMQSASGRVSSGLKSAVPTIDNRHGTTNRGVPDLVRVLEQQ